MKLSQLLGQRFKETPADCQIASHIMMLRGGYIKNVGNGIFSLFPPALRIVQKIENIIREEMNRIDGQEVLLPVAMPAALWKESGRYDAVGKELLRFKDRSGVDMVLGMTHEEAIVHLARDTAQSYVNFPFMIYQIQTKFRDEPRSRGGLIRVREFTMKDAYSFHLTQDDLEDYYDRCHKAYERIFARTGIPEVISVKSDTGMMGGKVAHEFMLITEVGEDTIVVCDSCDFRSNMEVAECIVKNDNEVDEVLECVETPNFKTIEEVCGFLNSSPTNTCKAVIYLKKTSYEPVVVFIRGDLEVNETKLQNFLKEEIIPDDGTVETGIVYGFVGPMDLTFKSKGTVLYDNSLIETHNLICGANKVDYHYKGFTLGRDMSNPIEYHDFAKTYKGAICPSCGKEQINICRGIEVGNIFQLGTRYTETKEAYRKTHKDADENSDVFKALKEMTYLDEAGTHQYPIMGCYGIGVGRLLQSVCEANHDENGPIWPMSIAPWQVHICAIRSDDPKVAEISKKLYADLTEIGVEVIFDDRRVGAGVMFADADLLGVPIRIIVSPKTLSRDCVEVSSRDKTYKEDVDINRVLDHINNIVDAKLAKFK